MRRSHALVVAAVAIAVVATVDGRLVLASASLATLAALTAPRRWLPGRGPRIALAAGAWLVTVRVGMASAAPPSAAWTEEQPAANGAWTATVGSVTRQAGGRQSAVLDLAGSGRVYARLPRYPEVMPGDVIFVEGRLEALPATPAPEDESWVAYLRRIGVSGTLDAESLRPRWRGATLDARLAQLREAAGDLIAAALPEPQAGLAGAILLGLRERVDPGLVRDFTKAGLTHVVAISGCHLAILAGVVGAFGRPLSRRARSLLVGAVIAAYAVLVGGAPSVMRAALMTGIALVAREGGRRAGASRALAIAVTAILLVDPNSILDPGLQLSAFATAGIVGWAGPLATGLERLAPPVPAAVRHALAVSLAAQAATLPVVLLDFGRLSLVAPLANLIVAPLVPVVMAAAALALPLGLFLASGLPAALASVALAGVALPLTAFVAVAHLAASVPFASVELPEPLAIPTAAAAAMILLRIMRRAGPAARPRRIP